MSPEKAAPNNDALQFDRALTPSGASDGSAAAVTCANCGAAITTEYFHVVGHSVCAKCRDLVLSTVATPRGWRPFLKSMAFGVGAAIAGAVIYYGVIAITNFEIGIVAILIGYMVGYMVRKGAGSKGGRRFQVLALVLTYWSVGLAYAPLALNADEGKDAKKIAATADSSRVARPDGANAAAAHSESSITNSAASGGKGAETAPVTGRGFLKALGMLFLLVFALPVIFVIGSLPSGLISALIIGIGLRQAWRMTATPTLSVSGPYKVGPNSSAASA